TALPVDALPHRGAVSVPSLRVRALLGADHRGRGQSRILLPDDHVADAHHGRRVRDVARGADHRAGYRQRGEPPHLLLHRGTDLAGDVAHLASLTVSEPDVPQTTTRAGLQGACW